MLFNIMIKINIIFDKIEDDKLVCKIKNNFKIRKLLLRKLCPLVAPTERLSRLSKICSDHYT